MYRALRITNQVALPALLCTGIAAGATLAVLVGLPWASLMFVLAVLVWVSLVVLYPPAALLLLPALVVTVDLTPWVGWSLLSELDLLLLSTLAAVRAGSLFRHPAVVPAMAECSRGYLIVALFCLSCVLSFLHSNGWPAGLTLQPDQIFYFSTEYRLSLLKGPLYGLVLLGIWRQLRVGYGAVAIDQLFYGAALATLALLTVVGWERGVWSALFSSGAYYERFSALLNFSSTYRITGLLSGMHAGGESIDGLLVILLALSGGGFLRFDGWRKLLFFVAGVALIYCVIVTFTRTTYAVFGMMCLVGTVLVISGRRGDPTAGVPTAGTLALVGLSGLITLAALVLVYRSGGYLGVLAGYGVVGIAILSQLAPRWMLANRWLLPALYAGAISLGVYGLLTSKWRQASGADFLEQLATLLLLSGLLHTVLNRVQLSRKLIVNGSVLLLVVSFLAVALLGSYRMGVRMESVGADIWKRLEHWQDVLETKDDSLMASLIGMGPGYFPLGYALRFPERVRQVGSYAVQDGGLLLGAGGDLKLAQRLSVDGDREYRLAVAVSAEVPGRLVVALCERHLLIQVNYYPSCVRESVSFGAGTQTFDLTLNSEHVGRRPWYSRWPTALHLWSETQNSPVLLHSISMQKAGGSLNLLSNGEFRSSRDWFFYNDFEHLPWHITNIPVAVFYEFGGVGALLFGVLLFKALRRTTASARRAQPFFLAGTLVVAGMLGVGLMGNPLDDPRIALLFYGLLFIYATEPLSRARAGENGLN